MRVAWITVVLSTDAEAKELPPASETAVTNEPSVAASETLVEMVVLRSSASADVVSESESEISKETTALLSCRRRW